MTHLKGACIIKPARNGGELGKMRQAWIQRKPGRNRTRPELHSGPHRRIPSLLEQTARIACVLLAAAVASPALSAQTPESAQANRALQFVPVGRGTPSAPANPNNMDELRPLENEIEHGQYPQAVPGLKRYLQDHPDAARAHYDLGYIYYRTHQIEGAVRQLSKSLELNGNNGQAHEILGLVCAWVGRYDLAEVELIRAARLEPNSAEIHYWLGRNYYTREVYPLAQEQFETAIRLDPSYMKAYYNLGLVVETLGKSEEAVRDYQTAARLAEEQHLRSPWPYEYLAAHYDRDKQPAEAIEFARKALLMDPRCDLAYYAIAKAYRIQGNWQQSADAAEKAIAINSHMSEYFYVLSTDLRMLGKVQESEAALKQFQKINKSQSTLTRLWQEANSEPSKAFPNPR
jgi:tetratricopeptide (TPR) repeat protein